MDACTAVESLSHPTSEFLAEVERGDALPSSSFFFFLNLFIYLFLAELGLCCCTRTFSSCGKRGLLFVAVHGLLIVVASLVAEHGL